MTLLENDEAYNKKYNVEWYAGNGKLVTTAAILENAGNGYLYFRYDNGGLLIIDQNILRSMECITW